MAQVTKTLTFLTSDLGKNAALVLTFDSSSTSSKYKTAFPAVWKVGNFSGTGQQAFKVEYQTEWGFICGLPAPVGIVYAYTPINPGEKTILTEGGNPLAHSFSKPTPLQSASKQMVAQNSARDKVDIGFGLFERSDRPPAQTLIFEDIVRGASVEVGETTPTLLGHVSLDYNYQEGEILKTPIPTPVVFTQDLSALEQDTYWKLEFNTATSKYVITHAP